MDEAVDGGDSHGGIGKDPVPFGEWLVAGDDERAVLVAFGDELEQDAGLGLVLTGVAEVIEDEAVEPIEPGEHGGERQIAPGGLKLLDKIGGAGEQDASAAFDEGVADCGGGMALAGSGWAKA